MRKPVTTFAAPQGHRGVFEVVHDDILCRPWGLYIVRWHGEEIGRQLSYPDREACIAMLRYGDGATRPYGRSPRAGNPANPPQTHRGLFSLIGAE